MSARARRAALLALLAAVLLVNPLYVPHLVPADADRSGTAYAATPVDSANASDHATLVRAVGEDDIVDVGEFADVNEYAFYGDEYRAPEAAARVLERAAETGNASTSDPDTAFTLRRVAATHQFAAVGEETGRYYRIDAERAGNATAVTAERVTDETVREFLVARDAVLYTSLPEYQRSAVDGAIDADDIGYLPADDSRLGALSDHVVVKGDTRYVVSAVGVADDFGPSPRGSTSFLLNALGALAFLAAAVLTALSYRAREN